MTTRDESDALTQFRERYAIPTTDVAAEIERRVIGAAWGANGYTTVEQADELAWRLDLGPGGTLLDVGTGRGWPEPTSPPRPRATFSEPTCAGCLLETCCGVEQ